MSDPKFEKAWFQNIKGMLRGVPFSDEMKSVCLREFEAFLSETEKREKDARAKALEDAAKVAEDKAQAWSTSKGREIDACLDTASAIRALQSKEKL